MRFLHLSDLHLGKKVNDISMLEEQKFVLKQAIELIKKEIDVVLISGDIFDRAIPNVFALELFSDFLKEISDLNVITIAISGNHDNSDRLSYLTPLLKKSNIYISKTFNGEVEYIDLKDNYRVYLMPYLYPALIRNYYPDKDFLNYNDAIKVVVDSIKLDKSKINILLAHQFVAGKKMPELSQSEQKSVGGVDLISSDVFKNFDYTALGHLHCPQSAGSKNIRYGGSILKYSFSEINQKKVFTIFEFDENKKIKFNFKDINFNHDLKEYRGYIDDFLDEKFYSKIKTDDYIHFILLDDDVIDAKKKLSVVYPNIMILEFDNKFTKSIEQDINKNFSKEKDILEHFKDFYKLQMNCDMDEDRLFIAKKTADEIGGIK